MKLSGTKKILLLGLILIIIAGIVVVALKGVNVSLLYEQHESVNLVVGKEIDINDIKDICKEVFNNKEVLVRKLELFDDAVNINVESMTDEEKQNLVSKVNEKYRTEFTAESINVNVNPKVRIRDIVRPYLIPLVIVTIAIVAYMVIRFRKIKMTKLLGKILAIILLTEATVTSIVTIARIPVTPTLINVMFAVAILELVLYVDYTEKNYKIIKD